MTPRFLIPSLLSAMALTACSSGSGTPGNIVYDTNNPSPLALFSNGYTNTPPALGTISRVRYEEGTDTLTITDAASPSSPITVQTAASITAAQQNLRTYTGGAAVPDASAPPGSAPIGHEIEVMTLNTDGRASWALNIRETDYATLSPGVMIWTDVGRTGAYGGDVYTDTIDDRRTGTNGSATMNGTLVFTRRVLSDAIVVGAPTTRNGVADVTLNVDFANSAVGGSVSNFINEIDIATGVQTPNTGTPIVYTLPNATLAADGTFTGANTILTPVNSGTDERTAHLSGQINGFDADEASGAINLTRSVTFTNSPFGFGETLRGTFVATE